VFDLIALAALSFFAALSGAVVPGPVFVVVVSESLKKGAKAGPLIVFGHLIIEALIIAAVLLGLDALLNSPQSTTIISYIGGIVFLLMGLYLINAARNIKGNIASESNTKLASHGLIAAGFLSSGSNPHFFLWWLTTGIPTMAIALSSAGTAGFIAFLIGHAAADLLWFSFISWSIEKGRNYLNQRAVKAILIGSAVFLLLFGSYLLLSAGSLWFS
jgi:threonine/homoserine/homoserine lactone efflux protein